MAVKAYSAFSKSPALLELHHQIALCHIQEIRWGVSYRSAEKQSLYSIAAAEYWDGSWRLVVTQIPVKNYRLTLVRKTLERVKLSVEIIFIENINHNETFTRLILWMWLCNCIQLYNRKFALSKVVILLCLSALVCVELKKRFYFRSAPCMFITLFSIKFSEYNLERVLRSHHYW